MNRDRNERIEDRTRLHKERKINTQWYFKKLLPKKRCRQMQKSVRAIKGKIHQNEKHIWYKRRRVDNKKEDLQRKYNISSNLLNTKTN